MAHVAVVQRKNGVAYEVNWRQGTVKKQKTFKLRRDADRFALRVENELAAGNSTEPLVKNGKTVAEVVEASLAASRPKLKPSTHAGYAHLYATRILPVFGKQRIAAVTSQQVEAWVAGMVSAGRAPSTVRNHYVALNKLFRYAMRHRLINHNPCDAVDIPRAQSLEDFAPVFLTAQQVESVAKHLDTSRPYGMLIRFAALTGLRSAEIAGLRVRDVNLAAGQIEVRQTIRKIGREWTVGTPKSARSTRTVPLLDRALIAELRKLLLTHPNSGEPDALFWPARTYHGRALDWTRPLDVASVRRFLMTPALNELGMPPMRFHDLRHTYASLMLAAGFKPYEVSRWMGHASVATTDGIYAHLYPSDYTDQIARFEAFVSQPSSR